MLTTRTIAIVQKDKGGFGRAAVTSNIGGLAALDGNRTLLVDMSSGGNLARDLGMNPHSGHKLLTALLSGSDLPVELNVRDRLDVVPGGPEMANLRQLVSSHVDATTALRTSLDKLAASYDLILIDSSCDEVTLALAAMGVAEAYMIPTRLDHASIESLLAVFNRFTAAQYGNQTPFLAGILLFAFGSRFLGSEASVRATIHEASPNSSAVFRRFLRHMEVTAVDSRRSGLLTYELEDAGIVARGTRELADDYREVTLELFERLELPRQRVVNLSSPHPNPTSIPITRSPVKSSNMVSVGYCDAEAILEVEFRRGRIYRYLKVPRVHFDGIMNAKSPTGYLNEHVKPFYVCIEV
jgi:chromosome partitioning protein